LKSSPELRYIKGENNVVADALSQLEMVEDPLTMYRHLSVIEMAELFAADDEDFPKDFPLSYAEIRYRQDNDDKIKALKMKPDECQFTDFKFGDSTYRLVTQEVKILLPASLHLKAV